MKALRIISSIVALIALAIWVYNLVASPRGKKFEIDKNHHVYYKGDGVTKDDASKTADYLKQIGLVQDSQGMDVQIKSDKPTDDVKFSLVFDKTKITPEVESAALGIGGQLSTTVFHGRKVTVALMDEDMEEIKNLGAATSTQTQPTDQNQTEAK